MTDRGRYDAVFVDGSRTTTPMMIVNSITPTTAVGGDAVLITTNQAALKLKISVCRVHQLIAARRLPARKVGRDWLIRENDLACVATRIVGRPRTKRGGVKE